MVSLFSCTIIMVIPFQNTCMLHDYYLCVILKLLLSSIHIYTYIYIYIYVQYVCVSLTICISPHGYLPGSATARPSLGCLDRLPWQITMAPLCIELTFVQYQLGHHAPRFHIFISTQMHLCIHTYIHTYIYIYTYIYIQYIYIYTYISSVNK